MPPALLPTPLLGNYKYRKANNRQDLPVTNDCQQLTGQGHCNSLAKMCRPLRAGLLVLCALLSSTASLFVAATAYSEDRVVARTHATYFTADFLSSHSSRKASRHFDSKPCTDRVYAGERNRSLRYLFGPTMDKAMNHQKYLESKTKSPFDLTVVFRVGFYEPFPASRVYAIRNGQTQMVDSSLKKSDKELTTDFDAYISMPSPHVDRAILNDSAGAEEAFLEIVCFKAASWFKRKMMPEVSFILEQIKKTGLLEQGRQIRRQQMIATYIGKDHTQRTYSQRVLEDSKPRNGEEVYWLTLPETSGPFYPGLFEDPLWTFELVIKFLAYAVPYFLEDHDIRPQVGLVEQCLNTMGIIPSISVNLMIQSLGNTFSFNHAVVQSQKYRFLETRSTISAMSYQESFIGNDVISPPIRRFIDRPCILLGARRTLLRGNEKIVCVIATIDPTPNYPMDLSIMRRLKMPFRIPKRLVGETAKRKEALRQLSEMTELNGLEENFDLDERILASNFPK